MPSSADSGGYGRPPAHSQFQKGKSGNPKGRPKKSAKPAGVTRSIPQLVLREAERPVTITEGGQFIKTTAFEVLIKGLFRSAMKGNPTSLKIIFMLLTEAWKDYDVARLEQVRIETSDPVEAMRQYRIMIAAGG